MKTPETPECDKLSTCSYAWNEISCFLDWYRGNGGAEGPLGTEPDDRVLAKYFDIDWDKVEQERREILKYVAETQNSDG